MLLLASGFGFGGGGIQVVARLAYEGLAGRGPVSLFVYGVPEPGVDIPPGSFVSTSRYRMAAEMVSRRPVGTAFALHLHLLRLLYVTRHRGPRVVMLNGIEAWVRRGWLDRRALARVDRFFSISQHTWDRFAQTYPEFADRPHEVVYLGIDSPAAGPIEPPATTPAVLMVSRLATGEDYKGHRELISVWPKVRAVVPGAELWIAGDGDLRPTLETLAHEAGVVEAVHFLGRVSEDRKRELFRACRCFAMPSRGEGFGLVYLEAMRVGRPCLVSTLDAGREVVNPPEAGLSADMDDPADLAAAVVRLLTPGAEWDAWSVAARNRYENQFTAAHFQDRIVDAVTRFESRIGGVPCAG
jgi:phosphatidylinositol alpha-1,6-mannosyltransferase